MKRRKLVTDAEGMPLQRAEALISERDFRELQEKLNANVKARTSIRRDRAALLGVVQCHCGLPMYLNRRKTERHNTYRCSSANVPGQRCGIRSVNAAEFDAMVQERFLKMVGGAEIVRREFVPGVNHEQEIKALSRALEDLREDRAAGLYADDLGKAEYREQYTKLSSRRTELLALPSTPDRWEEVATGQTYAERWTRLTTDAERNAEYIAAGVKVIVHGGELPKVLPLVDIDQANADETDATVRAHFGWVAIVTPANVHRKVKATNA